MRKDIEIHINTGDVIICPKNLFSLRKFQWVDNPSGLSRYIYGEISLPASNTESSIRHDGLHCSIPYTPKYKEMMIRIKRVYDDGSYEYVYNQSNGSEWFVVQSGIYGSVIKNIYASELITIADESYYISLNQDKAIVYASSESDFNIVNAERQNSNCLLACVPTNNYRHPLCGVGLIRWVNSSNINNGQLAEVIQREFNDDGMYVRSAYYDYKTHQMHLELTPINEE